MRAIAPLRTGLFLLAIVGPLAMMGRGDSALHEQRNRAPLPDLRTARGGYPQQFDAYFRDHFGWRDRSIRWYNLLKFRLLREAPGDRVIVGSDGWFFYSNPADGIDIRNFAGRWPHTAFDVDAWLERQDEREREYARAGSRYLIVIAPDKQSIYPQHVPYRYGPQAPGVLDELLARLRWHRRLHVLDLRPVLRPYAGAQLYMKGDSHWNARAAFLSAQAITEALRPALPAIGTIRTEDYDLTATPAAGGDLIDMIALGLRSTEEVLRYRRRTIAGRVVTDAPGNTVWRGNAGLPTAVLKGDSFGVALEWLLCDVFSRLHYDMTTVNGPVPNLVAVERPDVVVLILVERNLPRLLDQ